MNHYNLHNNLDTKPLLNELKLNDDWIDVTSISPRPGRELDQDFGKTARKLYGPSSSPEPTLLISLIESFRNPDDPEPINQSSYNTLPIESSTWTGIAPSKIFHKYKQVESFLDWFKTTYNGNIARVIYVKVPSGGSVRFHTDTGPYFEKHNKFHLVLQGKYQYTVNEETVEYNEGDLWWFNNKKTHGTYVHGSKDRISLIFDCECDMKSIINNDNGVIL